MIEARDAVKAARGYLGTPYEEMDCIALIREVIRTAPGGTRAYRCAGTNELWKSYDAVEKYKQLIWRGEGISNAKEGMLAFKRRDDDVHHVGIVTGEGTVVHASSVCGEVVETALDDSWHLLARHRLIEEDVGDYGQGEGVVRTHGGRLNVRSSPGGKVIATRAYGEKIVILQDMGDWLRIALDEGREGYVSSRYVKYTAFTGRRIRIIDEEGNLFIPEGNFSVEMEDD